MNSAPKNKFFMGTHYAAITRFAGNAFRYLLTNIFSSLGLLLSLGLVAAGYVAAFFWVMIVASAGRLMEARSLRIN